MGLEFNYVEDSEGSEAFRDGHVKGTVSEVAAEEKHQHLKALQVRLEELVDSMYTEDLLDYHGFSEFQMATQIVFDGENPLSVEEIITDHLKECAHSIEELDRALKADPVVLNGGYDCPVWGHGFRIQSSNSALGLLQVANWGGKLRWCIREEDKQGCLDALEKLKEAFNIVRPKLVTMLALEREIVAAGGTLYYMNGSEWLQS